MPLLTAGRCVCGSSSACLFCRCCRRGAPAFPARNIQFIIPYAAAAASILRALRVAGDGNALPNKCIVPFNIATGGGMPGSRSSTAHARWPHIGIFDMPGMFVQQAFMARTATTWTVSGSAAWAKASATRRGR